MYEESSQSVNYEEISKGRLFISALCSGVLCTLYSPSVTSRSTSTHIGVGSSLSATGRGNFGLSGFIDLRFPFLEFATLGLPRINLVPLPNLSHLYIWPFIPPSMQTELFSWTSHTPPTSTYSLVICHITQFPLISLLAEWHYHLSAACARNLETFLTSLSRPHESTGPANTS